MKKVIILNGHGGVGKDLFFSLVRKYIPSLHASIVAPIKQMATYIGYDGAKTEKDRKFLSDLKILVDNYNDFNYKYVKFIVDKFRNNEFEGNIQLLFIDMREKNQIDRAAKEFDAVKVLVKRDFVEQIKSNIADAGVYEVEYDCIVDNSSSIEDLEAKAKEFVEWIKATYE